MLDSITASRLFINTDNLTEQQINNLEFNVTLSGLTNSFTKTQRQVQTYRSRSQRDAGANNQGSEEVEEKEPDCQNKTGSKTKRNRKHTRQAQKTPQQIQKLCSSIQMRQTPRATMDRCDNW